MAHQLLEGTASALLHRGALSPAQARAAFDALATDIEWEQRAITLFGRRVLQPRLIAWHGDPGCTYRYSGDELHPRPWTPLLLELRSVCETLAGATFDAVLLNQYRDGDDSVGWHADDEPDLGDAPVIASLSLGATRRFDLRHRASGRTVSIDLPDGSLLVMSGTTQREWQHRIPKTRQPVAPRINLTFRRIRRTS